MVTFGNSSMIRNDLSLSSSSSSSSWSWSSSSSSSSSLSSSSSSSSASTSLSLSLSLSLSSSSSSSSWSSWLLSPLSSIAVTVEMMIARVYALVYFVRLRSSSCRLLIRSWWPNWRARCTFRCTSRKATGWTSRRVLIARDIQGRVRIDKCEYSEGLLAEPALASVCRKPATEQRGGEKRGREKRQ